MTEKNSLWRKLISPHGLWRKLLDNRKIIGLSLWKTKSYDKANASVEINKVYISKSKAKT